MFSIDSMVGFYSSFGYLAVFGVLLLCGFGLPIPEDISLLAGGIISGMEYTNVHLMVLIGFVGVMVGDTEFDMAMAKAAGFGALGVAWGYHPRARLEAAGADLVISDFDALDAALAELLA